MKSNHAIDPSLVQAWREAIYRVEAATGTVCFRIEQPAENLPALPACRSMTVVTACNPLCSDWPRAENERAQARLLAYVREQGFSYAPASGASPDGHHVEESLAVFDLDEAEARALGAHFCQGAVMYWDGDEARLIWMDAEPDRR